MKKKIVSLLLASAMVAGLLAGCGSSSNSSAPQGGSDGGSSDAPVELTMYVISNRPAGQDEVDAALNEMLMEKLGVTLKTNWIDWASYANKYPLLFSSGEQFDMAYCATWLNFPSLATKGAFLNLDELLPANAPKNYAMQSKEALEQATVDGHIYCVPTLLATYNAYGPMYRTAFDNGVDLIADGLWDGEMNTFEDLEEYMDAVKANTDMLEVLDISQSGPEIFFTWAQNEGYTFVDKGLRYMWIDPTEAKPTISLNCDLPGLDGFLDMMNRWNEKGFFTKSALSDTDTDKTMNGKAAVKVHNIDSWTGIAIPHPEYNMYYNNFVTTLAHLPFTQDCLVLANTCKNPEKALALWELITTDQEVFDQFYYGIEGTTYELNEEGQFKMLNTDLYGASACWAARTTELNRQQAGTPELFYELEKDWEENLIKSGEGAERLTGFVFDTTPVETEISNCANVWQQYWFPLELGYTDPVKGLEEYKSMLLAAGVEKIVAEAQAQLDAYCETH